jgi:methylmalonyl-CoA mutase C-terminal domain/subunit
MKEFRRDLNMQNCRVLIAKIGLDGHDRGARIIMSFLKDNGFEVIYSGLHNTPSQIIEISAQEDVQALGVSILSGSHLESMRVLLPMVREVFGDKFLIFLGGVIPSKDHQALMDLGVDRVFGHEETLSDLVLWLKNEVSKRGPVN